MSIYREALHGFERDADQPSSLPERRNMRYGIIHGAFFSMATAFADPYAVLPLFLAGFTDSRALIGFIVSLTEAVGVFPQLGISRQLRRNPASARGFMLTGIWMRCAAWGLIAAITLLFSKNGLWMPGLFVFLIALFSLGGGIAVLPFKYVITETIPPERRSSFFGWRLAVGGVFAVAAGILVRQVLGFEHLVWPRNYGVLFLLSFLALAVAYIAMSRFRFPPHDSQLVPEKLPPLMEETIQTLRDYSILKRLIAVRWLSGGLPLVLPFLTLYATHEMGISLAWIGIFIAAQKGGAILSNLGWMPIGNRFGTRYIILSGLALSVLSLILILLSKTPMALTVAFAMAGAAMSALIVGFNGYILELGTKEVRPLLFALEGTLLLPLRFMPWVGGWIADQMGYRPLVLMGMGLLLGGLVSAATLCEPRRHDPACGPCA